MTLLSARRTGRAKLWTAAEDRMLVGICCEITMLLSGALRMSLVRQLTDKALPRTLLLLLGHLDNGVGVDVVVNEYEVGSGDHDADNSAARAATESSVGVYRKRPRIIGPIGHLVTGYGLSVVSDDAETTTTAQSKYIYTDLLAAPHAVTDDFAIAKIIGA